MNEYHAIYDAVKNRIDYCETSTVIRDAVKECFDISHLLPGLAQDCYMTLEEYRRPSVVYRPKLSLDGNQWCALYGDDLQEGVAGFGDTPELAMRAFDAAWRNERYGVE